MGERQAGYVVTLAEDLYEEDAEAVLNALRMVKGVLSVEPIRASFEVIIATERAKGEAREKILALLKEL